MQRLFGGDGDDYLVGHFGAEELHGGKGNDIIDLVANVFQDGSIGIAFGGSGADLFHALDYDIDGQFPGLQEIYGGEETYDVVLQDGTVVQREYQDAVDFGDGEVSLLNPIRNDGVWIDLSDSAPGFPGQQARGISLLASRMFSVPVTTMTFLGDDFDNVLIGRGGNDEIRGGAGDDVILGGQGDNDLFGDDGDDIFIGGNGDGDRFNGVTEISGGDGIDTISFQPLRPDGRGSTAIDIQSMGHVVVLMDSGFANFTFDDDNPLTESRTDFTSMRNATGTRRNDGLTGNDGDNVLVADAGDDFVRGRGGNDTIIVGTGNDQARGDDGDDVFIGASGNNEFNGDAGFDLLDFSSNSLGVNFDLDGQSLTADYLYSVHVFADQADSGGTLAERAAYTKQSGSNDSGALGVRSIMAEDVFKIENSQFADRYFQLEEGFVRSTIGADGKVLLSYAFVEQSEVRSYTNTISNLEAFTSGAGDDNFTYTAGTGFAGLLDGGAGLDTLDLTGITQLVGFATTGGPITLTLDGVAQGLQFQNIERVLTATGEIVLNTDPIAVDDVESTDKATAFVTDNVLINDTDGNTGDTLTVIGFDTASTVGLVTNNGDGTFEYDPNGAFDSLAAGRLASDRFTYEISDGNGSTDTATVVITIRGSVRPLPEAQDDAGISGNEDEVVLIDPAHLLANDTGGNGIDSVGNATNGSVEINVAGQIEFTPVENFNGQATFTYQISNSKGETSQANVMLVLNAVNDAPTVVTAIADQSATEDSAFSFVVPADAFADVDVGDSLSYTATLSDNSALPSWLMFNAATRTFSGTPLNGDVGSIQVKVTATDTSSAAVSDTFALTIGNSNDAPTVVTAIADQSATEDSAFSFVVPADAFADVDVDVGDSLSYTATLSDNSALPSWLMFNAATRTFSGTPLNGDVGSIQVKVTATDTSSAAVSDTFALTIGNSNDAPTVVTAIADQSATEDSAFSFVVPADAFADVDVGDSLSYTATLSDNSALPSWLMFNAATRTFSGTPLNGDVGSIQVKVTATDTSSAAVSDTFALTIGNSNDAPTVVTAIADQSATEDSAFSFVVPADAFADVDVGDSLSYTATLSDNSALPSWLMFNAATRTFSGTPLNGDVGSIQVNVTATDTSSAAVSDTFALTIGNSNDAPTVVTAIADESATEDSAFSFVVPADAFADVDVGDSLSYTATLSDNSALPSWLMFNAATRTFSGTPLNGDVGPNSVSVKVTATDSGAAAISDTFEISVLNITGGPDNGRLYGGPGDQTIAGGSNVDTAIFSGNRTEYTLTRNADNSVTINGPDGMDQLISVERLQFDDGTFKLPSGMGQSFDPHTADPNTFMSAIRDFDGNDVGASIFWRKLGTADIDGDGDIEILFYNPFIGRWASVGIADDDQVYMANNGWGGDTRVIGNYIDPLVSAGEVEAWGPFDSQTRFRLDLITSNLGEILGADDYDKDGLQEIYFALNDGTAYLHLYMHADGNIQYANYQNEQQVKDYMASNGVAASVYDEWFA